MKNETDKPHDTPEKIPLLVGDEAEEEQPQLLVNDPPQEYAVDEDSEEEEGADKLERSYDLPGPAWMGYIFASLPIFACLFGAGRETWSKGIITTLLGVLLIFFTPRRRLPLVAMIGLAGALLAPLLSFLPVTWLFEMPAWRKLLEVDWEIALSKTLTPQAAVSMEAWLFFSVCCVWLGWCMTRGFSDLQRRAMVHMLTFGGILLCVLSIMEGSKLISIPWWPRNQIEWGHGFGPFANRNHISSLAAMTAVLCAAASYDAHRRKSRLWLLFVLGFLAPVICIFMNSSRAGLVLLFLGMTTWFGTIAMRRGFFQKLAVSSSLIFIIATLLVMSGGNISKRLTEEGIANFASGQGRGGIYGECLKMILESPWMGIGMGNFDSLFPQFSKLHDPVNRYIHPESDLLWLLAEGGLLTVLPGMLLLLWIFLSTGPWFGKKKKRKSGMQDRRLRNAAAIVFGLGVIHGLGDVPSHGLAYALFMALLAGIAIRPRRLPQPAERPQRIAFRLGGLAALALGAAWLAIALGHPALPGTSSAEALRVRADKLVGSGSPSDALPLMNQAIQMRPMDFRLYFERARIRLMLGQPSNDALTDFSRSRMLEPQFARYCYVEGVIWLDYNPSFALIAWRDVLRRWPGYNYWAMLQHARQHPELLEPLWSLATTANLKMEYLYQVTSREEFDVCLRSLLTQQPDLEGLEPAQRERLFGIWYQHGNPAALVSALETNRKWRDDGWRLLAEHYARNSDFQRACQTVIPYLPSVIRTAPGTSTDIPALERALLYNPTDARRGIDLFQAQKTQGDIDGALRTLEKVAAIPNAPPYIRQEIAALYIMKQDFRRAWEQLREAMQKR